MNITAPTPLTRFVNLINGHHRKPVCDWPALVRELCLPHAGSEDGTVFNTRKGTVFMFSDAAIEAGYGLNQMYLGALVPYGTPVLFNDLIEHFKDGIPDDDKPALRLSNGEPILVAEPVKKPSKKVKA